MSSPSGANSSTRTPLLKRVNSCVMRAGWVPFRPGLALFCAFAACAAVAQQRLTVPRADGATTPLRVYSPPSRGCAPVALISPGAGGDENGYSYLAEGLRASGYQAIVMGHHESGRAALRSDIRQRRGVKTGLEALVTDPKAYRARLMDIAAALQWSASACKPPFLALLGHSMGARTVMVEAGAKNALGVKGKDQFNAYVALSPDGPGPMFPGDAWSEIQKPMLLLTGTRDKGLDGDWKTRTIPYDRMPAGCKWLGVINGATHMNFAGVGFAGSTEKLVLLETKTFLEALRAGKCGVPLEAEGISIKNK